MRKIKLYGKHAINEREFALVDDKDYDKLMERKWFVHLTLTNMYYVVGNFKIEKNKWKVITMHRHVMNAINPKEIIDHKNGNTLDNQKQNLRTCTPSDNLANRFQRGGKSKYLGVCWKSREEKWIVTINKNKKQIYIGSFEDEIDAAKAYDNKAQEIHGEFANLNFPI